MRYPAFASLPRVLTLALAIGSQASLAQDLGLELFARMHMPSGKLVERSIKNDDLLRSGDELRAIVRVSSPGFLYVLHQGITRGMVLYPASLEPTAAIREWKWLSAGR